MNVETPARYSNTRGRPAWSPDGSKVAVEKGRDVLVVSRENEVLARLGPEDRWVATPAWSPDGESIAYAVYTRPEGKDVSSWGVYLADADGSDARPLTHSGWHPVFSPDGERIAFSGLHDLRHARVSVMDANGFNERPIAHEGDYQEHFSWDPRGQQVVYENVGEDGHTIDVADHLGSKHRRIASGGRDHNWWDRNPEWSPDGKAILFERHHPTLPITDLWTVDPYGKDERQITQFPGRALDPVWSPDGSQIAFVSAMDGDDLDLYVIDADGTDLRKLSDLPGDEHAPSWAPDGKSIAFLTLDFEKEGEDRHGFGIVKSE